LLSVCSVTIVPAAIFKNSSYFRCLDAEIQEKNILESKINHKERKQIYIPLFALSHNNHSKNISYFQTSPP